MLKIKKEHPGGRRVFRDNKNKKIKLVNLKSNTMKNTQFCRLFDHQGN